MTDLVLRRFPPSGKLVLVGRVWNQVNSELQRYIEFLCDANAGNVITQTNLNNAIIALTQVVADLPDGADNILAGQVFGF